MLVGGVISGVSVADSHTFSPVVHAHRTQLSATGVFFPVWSSLFCPLAFMVYVTEEHTGKPWRGGAGEKYNNYISGDSVFFRCLRNLCPVNQHVPYQNPEAKITK